MTSRKFKVIMVQQGDVTEKEIDAFGFLHGNYRNGIHTHEWVFSIEDIFDEVLDLKTGETMYFQPNRDDKDSRGIIIRIA